jgi:crossover junction endodeoxyribonuclease RuvC
MNNIYIGIDQSMNSTGFIAIDNTFEIIKSMIISSNKDLDDYERIMELGDKILLEILKFIEDGKKLFCCLEGISFGSQGRGIIQQGSLHNYLRILFKKYNIQHIVCTPTQLKKYITGKGQCKKELMLMKIYKKWGVEFDSSDLADAYALARFCKEVSHE